MISLIKCQCRVCGSLNIRTSRVKRRDWICNACGKSRFGHWKGRGKFHSHNKGESQ